LGQAVVSYEIFTARTLPRNGLFQHWRRALILAAGYSLLVSWTLTIQLRPIYSLLLTTLLMTIFFAMLAWRSYAERERFMRSLRPFLSAANVYARILDPASAETFADVTSSFTSLCSDLLETRQACLIPLGPMAPLAGPPITFPAANQDAFLPLSGLATSFSTPEEKGLPLDPEQHGGYIWAVPLWSERGLVGALLLGEKRTGGLYTQEEIETARAAGERLIDQKASAELAGRLAKLERQHLSHSQVMDQHTRRVLHDEVLPLVHTALLRLSPSLDPAAQESLALMTEVHHQLSDLLRSMAATLSPEVNRLGVINALRQVIERDLTGRFQHVYWQIEADAEAQINMLPPLQGEVFFFAAREALRNAARYGQPTHDLPLEVTIRANCENGLRLVIQDNGGGIQTLAPAADHAEPESSGQGLALHSTLMAVIGGTLSLESEPGLFTRVVLSLPTRE
jgi:signal transduction histidine kinase